MTGPVQLYHASEATVETLAESGVVASEDRVIWLANSPEIADLHRGVGNEVRLLVKVSVHAEALRYERPNGRCTSVPNPGVMSRLRLFPSRTGRRQCTGGGSEGLGRAATQVGPRPEVATRPRFCRAAEDSRRDSPAHDSAKQAFGDSPRDGDLPLGEGLALRHREPAFLKNPQPTWRFLRQFFS